LSHTRQLPLPARPASVRVARVWVRDLLEEYGRRDLVPSAILAVSELVTNAIIHGRAPVSVAVRGNEEHPVIEVHDGGPPSWRPMTVEAIQGTEGPATIGRGLSLVAMSSVRWGTRDETAAHTVVWFEPSAEMHDRVDLSPVLENADGATGPTGPAPADGITIVLTNMPVRLYAEMRRHHYELRRELGLLLFEHPHRFPIATTTIAAIDGASAQRRPGSGFSRIESAAADGLETIDLTYVVRPATPLALVALRDALNACYDTLGDDLLLTVQPAPEVRHFQDWFFGEVIDQAAGAEPTPWRGPLSVSHTADQTH